MKLQTSLDDLATKQQNVINVKQEVPQLLKSDEVGSNPALFLTSYVTLGKLLSLHVTVFSSD